ncbi:patatin-like phospholipase [Legionella busanensis]|uniref:Patatin-like phospholipase n=1 Tax=Legionella busanensis TaxID=190655 RepID=A0A378KA01_9GAMM|nr:MULTISPECIES: patatin-like phospholipase family protein [Legionella]STX81536.1 patatin-like phospholipase [Legionella busanensis]
MAKYNKPDFRYDRIAFLFDGGGALGAFQVGVYEALYNAGYSVNWVSGISIGAINAAIVAGNRPEYRIDKLKEFWHRITRPDYIAWWEVFFRQFDFSPSLVNAWQAQSALFYGQPSFFHPRLLSPYFTYNQTPDKISFYETAPLRDTLNELIDFKILNSGNIRLTLSAVQLSNGQQVHFDSKYQTITLDHIMASSALPPSFPAVKIDKEYYWDGALVNNSSLEVILDDLPRVNTLCFMMQLFDPEGTLPNSLDKILLKQKDIIYTSNSNRALRTFCEAYDMRHMIKELYKNLPEPLKKKPQFKNISLMEKESKLVFVKFHRHEQEADLASKDYNFSAQAIAQNIIMGCEQATNAIKNALWNKAESFKENIILYDMFPHAVEQKIFTHGKEIHKQYYK